MTLIQDQPQPKILTNNSPSMHDLVIADLSYYQAIAQDMAERKEIGLQRYGTILQAFNGRDAEIDAYQELLDFLVYIKQAIREGKGKKGKIDYENTYKSALMLAADIRKNIEENLKNAQS